MRTKKYELLIFDFDGTLCATHNAIIEAMKQTFEFYKQPILDIDKITTTIGKSLEDTLFILSDGKLIKNEAVVKEWIKTYRDFYSSIWKEHTSLFDNVKEICADYIQKGIKIVVISNKGLDAINGALNYYGIMEYVSFVVGDEKGINKKPDSMPYDKIIEPNFPEIKKENILMIGDTDADLEFAKNINVDACWCKYGYGNIKKCEELKPKYSITSFNELIKVVG
ncbi:MAG: HAD family hydrolase [Lentisphaerae bacterium]|nr:HAD family hydrolase [Lentisphaerota bacterium]MCP4103074.1 HAD family hydrolase [Lentisphaerota bacterium]